MEAMRWLQSVFRKSDFFDGVEEEYRLELRMIRFDRHMLKQIIQNGVPSGFQNSVIAAFNRDPSVIHYGVMQARIIALFYCLLAFSHCIAAVLRGSGHAAVPMIVMLCDWCLFRVSYITVAVRLISDIRVIFWAYPLTWSISSVIFLYLFLRGKWVYGFEKENNKQY